MTSAQAAEPSQLDAEFRELFATHYAFVWRSLLHFGLGEAAADDAAQEVFLIVHRKLHEFDRQRAFRSWVYGIARRVASTAKRSALRDDLRVAAAQQATEVSDPGRRLELKRDLDWVKSCLMTMPEEQREVFVLTEIEGLAAPEVAAAVEAPLNTVYSRLRLARQRFNAALERREQAHMGHREIES